MPEMTREQMEEMVAVGGLESPTVARKWLESNGFGEMARGLPGATFGLDEPAIHGVPEPERAPNYSAPPASARLLERTSWGESGCLEWTGTRDRDGYAHLKVDGRLWQVHRLAWVLHFGRIPTGLVVMHVCDNPRCVWIGHLALATQEANNFDRTRKGRGVTPGDGQ